MDGTPMQIITIKQADDGTWQVLAGQTVLAACQTNAEAWRAYDMLANEPISKSEDTADWLASKILNSWP
jgi:hypothetical protein